MVGAHSDVKCQNFGIWETPRDVVSMRNSNRYLISVSKVTRLIILNGITRKRAYEHVGIAKILIRLRG